MEAENQFKDLRGRTWETFPDPCYFNLICVRCVDAGKEFDSQLSFHFNTQDQAEQFKNLLKEAR